MSDEWKYKELPRASGKIAPAQWNPETGEWEVFTGLAKVQDVDVKTELESIKQTQSQILAKLNDTIDTRLTGSIVEQVERRKRVILRERIIRDTSISFSNLSVPSGATGAIFILDIHGVTGTFDSGEGISVAIRFENWYGGTLTTDTTNKRTLQYAIFYPNAYRGDYEKYISDGDMKISQLPLVSRLSYAIPITGTFGAGEGFDCTVMVEWLF